MGGMTTDRIKGVYVITLNSETTFQLCSRNNKKFSPGEIADLIRYGNDKN